MMVQYLQDRISLNLQYTKIRHIFPAKTWLSTIVMQLLNGKKTNQKIKVAVFITK